MLDLLITNGLVVDGSGRPAFRGSVGIRNGSVVALGEVDDSAKRTVDASGLVVAPGFVDPHTHYDAQLFWDPSAAPSSEHGVTTVLAGNCGFTLAPVRPKDADYLRRMMAVVEGMSVEALEEGLPWSWQTFGEFLDALEGRISVNVGFMVGHCALRQYVMGEAALEREARPAELNRMTQVLDESIAAGALGLSTTRSPTHVDDQGAPVSARRASVDELLTLCSAVGRHEGTSLEGAFAGSQGHFEDDEIALIVNMTSAAARPINWNLLTVGANQQDVEHQLSFSNQARLAGGDIVALTMPVVVPLNVNFLTHNSLNNLPGWNEVLTLPIEERMRRLSQEDVRAQLEENAHSPEVPGRRRYLANFDDYVIGDTWAPENQGLAGRRAGDIARERGISGFNVILDIACADALKTILWPAPPADSDETWAFRAQIWNDPRTLLGGSDAGAHLDRMCGGPYPTRFLADALRGRKLLQLERAVQLLTDAPARLFGFRDRGRLAVGAKADIVIFDPATVGSREPALVYDLPGGAYRMTAASTGIEHVFVNGVETVTNGKTTGRTSGMVLRSGRDTSTSVIKGRA